MSVTKMKLVPYKESEHDDFVENRELKTDTLQPDLIVETIPKKFKTKALSLLRYLTPILKWNSRGEICTPNGFFTSSHIADLIRYSIQKYGKSPPTGYTEFMDIINTANIPKTLTPQLSINFKKTPHTEGEGATVWKRL